MDLENNEISLLITSSCKAEQVIFPNSTFLRSTAKEII